VQEQRPVLLADRTACWPQATSTPDGGSSSPGSLQGCCWHSAVPPPGGEGGGVGEVQGRSVPPVEWLVGSRSGWAMNASGGSGAARSLPWCTDREPPSGAAARERWL